MDHGYRGAGALLERVAVLEDENARLRARVEELEEAARSDDRHVLLRRAEKERDQLRDQLVAYRAKRDADEAVRVSAAVERATVETERAIAAARVEVRNLTAETNALREKILQLDELANAGPLAEERDALRDELASLKPHVRGENEAAYIHRLVEERDDLLAEVRRLKARR